MHSAIKDTSMILDKKIDEILHLDSKTSTKVFETKSIDSKPKPSYDITSRPVVFDYLDEPAIFNYLEEHPFFSF